jgi:hypothetical protein
MAIIPVVLGIVAAFKTLHLALRWRARHTPRGRAYFEKYQLGDQLDNLWQLSRRSRSHMIVTTMVSFFFVSMPITQEITKILTCQPYEDTPGTFYAHAHRIIKSKS